MLQTFYKNSNPIIAVLVEVRKRKSASIRVKDYWLDTKKISVELIDPVLYSADFFIYIFTVQLYSVFPKELIKIIFKYITTKY